MKTLLSVLVLSLLATSIFSQNLQLRKKKGKYGFIANRQVVIDYQFDKAKELSNQTFLVMKNDMLGLVQYGSLSLPCEYDKIDAFETKDDGEKDYLIYKNGKYGIYENQVIVIPCAYDNIKVLSSNNFKFRESNERHFLVSSESKFGVYKNQDLILPCEFDQVNKIWEEDSSVDEFIVVQDEKYGLYKGGKLQLACEYDDLKKLSDDRYMIQSGDKAGIVNEVGDIILPSEYESIHGLKENIATVKLDGEWKYYNIDTKEFSDDDVVFKVVDRMPLFDKCREHVENPRAQKTCSQKKMLEFVYGNLRYPPEARAQRIQGDVVIKFTIDSDGNVIDPEIFRDIGGGCGEEGLRVVESMDKWIPGEMDGQSVDVVFHLPVKFKLQ